MSKKILFLASNYGLWAEELEAPWNALKNAGHQNTLATFMGKTPLPLAISLDSDFIDPLQNYQVNPPDVVARTNALLESGEWDNPIKITEAKMEEYDALVIVGGPGAAFDLAGNGFVHNLILNAYKSGKIIGALCYAVAALAFTRDPENNFKSVIFDKRVTAHPHAWDFDSDMGYTLVNTTEDNKGTDIITCGFAFPLQYMTEDAVGSRDKVNTDETASREKPCVEFDFPFVTALSVESSIAFGQKLVDALEVK